MVDSPAKSSQLYQEARRLMNAGNLQEAILLFQQSIALSPHFKALELLGECYIRLGRLTEAIVPLAAATTLNRGVRAPALLAEAFLQLGEHERAQESAEVALKRDPNNKRALNVQKQLWEIGKERGMS